MARRFLLSVILCTVACFGMLGLALGFGWSPKLGLDLQGGLSVVYKPVPSASEKLTPSTLQTVANIMSARIGAFGVSQPNITVQGGDIVVQLPGVKDANTILNEIGNTAQLFFRPVLCGVPPYTPSKSVSSTDYYPTTALCTAPYKYTSSYYSSTQGYSPPTQDIENPAYAGYTAVHPQGGTFLGALAMFREAYAAGKAFDVAIQRVALARHLPHEMLGGHAFVHRRESVRDERADFRRERE